MSDNAPSSSGSKASSPTKPKQRTITDPITNLRAHVRFLYEPIQGSQFNGFDAEFNYIEKVSKSAEYHKAATVATLPFNFMPKNRYANVLAPDETRVRLESLEGVPGSDYINANYITDFYTGEPTYICAQGPTAATIGDFWRMIWEKNLRVIAMLTKEVEKNIPKCVRYWPSSGSTTIDNLTITHVDESEVIPNELIRRVFDITHKNSTETRRVYHFQYIAWPDHGLPASTKAFVILSDEVDAANRIGGDPQPPIAVHCSAGIGRSGTFATVHTIVAMLRKYTAMNKTPPPLNIVNTVLHLRRERPGMVQTKEQFIFCYLAVLEEHQRLRNEAKLSQAKGLPSGTEAPLLASSGEVPLPQAEREREKEKEKLIEQIEKEENITGMIQNLTRARQNNDQLSPSMPVSGNSPSNSTPSTPSRKNSNDETPRNQSGEKGNHGNSDEDKRQDAQ